MVPLSTEKCHVCRYGLPGAAALVTVLETLIPQFPFPKGSNVNGVGYLLCRLLTIVVVIGTFNLHDCEQPRGKDTPGYLDFIFYNQYLRRYEQFNEI